MMMRIKKLIKQLLRIDSRRSKRWFLADQERFWRISHMEGAELQSRQEAWIGIEYHIIEKGLTMPARHLPFGKLVMRQLIADVDRFLIDWGKPTFVIEHAIGVVREYVLLHEESGQDFADDAIYWTAVREFAQRHSSVGSASQRHFSFGDFYAKREMPFSDFARSRHTVRNYSEAKIPQKTIVEAVELAMTAPSACNRQHARVHCISDRTLVHKILEIQGGNRGFGHLADKVLVVTSDLTVEMGERERNDPYVNGGIFTMNLCYALHYHKVAHCILSCSIEPWRVNKIRLFAGIPEREVLVCMLSCGIAPEEFDVAASPRKSVNDILTFKD